jgi:hypothetical protein
MNLKKTIDHMRQAQTTPWPLIGALTMFLLFVGLARIFGK